MTTDAFTEITEGDWKTLATTEITHLTDEEKDYLPRAWDEWIARVKRDAAREALAAAEHRATRAEAQSAIRGRAVVIYRERAREAEAGRDCRRRENAELRDELVATQEYGAKLAHCKDEAEERIEAVRALHTGTRWPGVTDKPICDACDQPWPCPTIRALDGDT